MLSYWNDGYGEVCKRVRTSGNMRASRQRTHGPMAGKTWIHANGAENPATHPAPPDTRMGKSCLPLQAPPRQMPRDELFPIDRISTGLSAMVSCPRTAFERVLGATIGTQRFTGILYGEKDTRMRIP